jgi:hypothetical protein
MRLRSAMHEWLTTLGGWVFGAALVCAGGYARAQPKNNDYAVDLFQGPILAPARLASMGGAYAGYAEGIAGFVANAAAPAVREPWSLTWFDQDLDASISIPLRLFDNNDFDNSGDIDADYNSFLYLAAGGLLQVGPFGVGFFGDLQRYTLTFEPGGPPSFVTVGRYHLLVGWHFFENQLALGGGVRALTMGIEVPGGSVTAFGAAPQVGVLVRPDWSPLRFGATYRHAVDGSTFVGSGGTVDEAGVRRTGALVLPESVVLPWEVEFGVALQVGARPLSPSWINPHDHEQEVRDAYARRAERRRAHQKERLRAIPPGPLRVRLRRILLREEREIRRREAQRMQRDLDRLIDERRSRGKNWPRESLLLTLDLLVTGPVEDAIHLERFLGQGQPLPPSECLVVASGEEFNFSPRFGVEMEPVKQWVHTRFGGYYEPQRYRYEPKACNDRVGRQHFTFGADVRVLSTTWWGLTPEITYKLMGYADLAPRYQSLGASIGVWH